MEENNDLSIGTMGFQEGELDHVYMNLFPFPLAGKSKE